MFGMTGDELLKQARRDYGDLIALVLIWPPGLGIDVHLIGGAVVQYHPDGQRHLVEQPSGTTKACRRIAAARGAVQRFLRLS